MMWSYDDSVRLFKKESHYRRRRKLKCCAVCSASYFFKDRCFCIQDQVDSMNGAEFETSPTAVCDRFAEKKGT